MPDGAVYEVRPLESGWEARRGTTGEWAAERSVAFALIRAAGLVQRPGLFATAAWSWERELRDAQRTGG